MKKILMALTAALIAVACSAPPAENEQAKRQQLQALKQQMYEMKQQIESLEDELESTSEEEVVNVKVAEIETRTFEHFIEVTGKVEAEYNVDVNPETAGVITEVIVTEGQAVPKGFVMGKISTDILERTVEELKIQLELAATNFKRQQNLWDQNIGSEMQYLQAKNNKESLEKRIDGLEEQIKMSEIKAPISGVVDVIYQKKGNIGNPQTPFAKLVNIGDIKIYADISESYITKISKGDKVKIYFPALDREVEAPIVQIGNTIDPNNRTFRVRINLKNPDKMIKPNLVSIVKIRDYKAEDAIVVPSLYVKEDFNGDYTFVVKEKDGKTVAEKVYVTTGVTDNNMTEITEGLQAGDKVISEGFSQVADGTVIQF